MPREPDAYSSSRWAEDYAEIVQAFGLKFPVHVGWSVTSPRCTTLHPDADQLIHVGATEV